MAPDQAISAEAAPLRIQSRTLSLPKGGNSPEDYEDAAWPRRAVRRGTRAFRCAVADGATETSFAGLWARLLVRAYCEGRLRAGHVETDIARLQALWASDVDGRSLPWYAEEKVRSGAFSSLLGVTIDARGEWRSMAMGDTCVVQRRGDTLLAIFPLEHSADFTNRPALIGSRRSPPGEIDRGVLTAVGTWESNDVFYLMTDALAQWYLKATEDGARPWLDLDAVAGASLVRFQRFVTAQRHAGTMRNDDSTLLHVVVE